MVETNYQPPTTNFLTMTIDVGDRLPNFTLPDETGADVALSEFAGSRLIMFFYPKAMTPGCTAEACDFRDNYRAFFDAGLAVVGVSPDPPPANARFKDKEELMKRLDKIKNVEIGKMKIDKIVLYESQLRPGGPVYKEIKKKEW